MAAPIVNMRVPPALLALIEAKASRLNMSRTEVILDVLHEAFAGFADEAEPAPRKAPKPKAAPKSIQRPAPADKPGAARAALQNAESRTGAMPARLDTSMVAVHDGRKRPAYQRGAKR